MNILPNFNLRTYRTLTIRVKLVKGSKYVRARFLIYFSSHWYLKKSTSTYPPVFLVA